MFVRKSDAIVADTHLISTPVTRSLAFVTSDPFSSTVFPFMATEVVPFLRPLPEEAVAAAAVDGIL